MDTVRSPRFPDTLAPSANSAAPGFQNSNGASFGAEFDKNLSNMREAQKSSAARPSAERAAPANSSGANAPVPPAPKNSSSAHDASNEKASSANPQASSSEAAGASIEARERAMKQKAAQNDTEVALDPNASASGLIAFLQQARAMAQASAAGANAAEAFGSKGGASKIGNLAALDLDGKKQSASDALVRDGASDPDALAEALVSAAQPRSGGVEAKDDAQALDFSTELANATSPASAQMPAALSAQLGAATAVAGQTPSPALPAPLPPLMLATPQDAQQSMSVALSAMRSGNLTQAVLNVSPEHLGPIQVSITMDSSGQGAGAQIEFKTASAQAQDVIDRSLAGLKETLANQGIKISEARATHDPSLSMSSQGQNPRENPQQRFERQAAGNGFAALTEVGASLPRSELSSLPLRLNRGLFDASA